MLYKYYLEIIKWNQKINLTAIKEENDFINKHFIDSLTIAKWITEESKEIIDVGTGAGFPGIPIHIITKKPIVLLDALNKRLKVIQEIANNLELSIITTMHGRVEEIFQKPAYRENYDVVVSRAVANMNVLAEYMLPGVKVGGYCVCMKADDVDAELKDAARAIELLGGTIEQVEKMILPETDIKRSIVIIKKIKNTPAQYPRKAGTPSKQPLC